RIAFGRWRRGRMHAWREQRDSCCSEQEKRRRDLEMPRSRRGPGRLFVNHCGGDRRQEGIRATFAQRFGRSRCSNGQIAVEVSEADEQVWGKYSYTGSERRLYLCWFGRHGRRVGEVESDRFRCRGRADLF